MNRLFVLALFSVFVTSCATASAEDKQRDHRLSIRSDVLGEERLVLIRTPVSYDGNGQRYPVLYMTDGADIAYTTSTIDFLARSDRIPDMIVVGITNTDRIRDLTPTKPKDAGNDVTSSGGADKFLTFIQRELIPQIEKTYRTEPYRIFAGHSAGGLLAMHALATRNDLFDAYIASSPSLWWDNQFVIRETEEFLKGHNELNRTLFITLGNEQGQMRAGFDKAKEVLGRYHPKGFVWDSMLLTDETHRSVGFLSLYFGLKKIFDGWQPSEKTLAGGMKAVQEHFKKLSARYKYTVLPSESLMNQLGYELLSGGKKDEAIAVFELNVKQNPNSANVYDSLAEAYEKNGQLDLAEINYEKAVQLGTRNDAPSLRLYQINFERVSKALKSRGKSPGK
jgi:predicted alpha/beta superfamily hydrolase